MSDALKALATKNADKLILAGMGVATLVVGFFRLDEMNTAEIPPPEVQQVDLKPIISSKEGAPESEAYFKAISLIENLPPFEQSKYQPLIEFNPFDPKAARDAEDLEKRADEILKLAKNQLDTGDLDGAEARVREALKTRFKYKPAEEMLAEIQKRRGGSADAAAPPATDAAAAAPPATPAP